MCVTYDVLGVGIALQDADTIENVKTLNKCEDNLGENQNIKRTLLGEQDADFIQSNSFPLCCVCESGSVCLCIWLSAVDILLPSVSVNYLEFSCGSY